MPMPKDPWAPGSTANPGTKYKGEYGFRNINGKDVYYVVDGTNRFTAEKYTGATRDGGNVVDGVLQAAAPAATPGTTGTQTRGYVETPATKDPVKAILLQEDTGSMTSRESSRGGGGSSSGMLSDNQPLGFTLDEDNRYLRRSGAVLLR